MNIILLEKVRNLGNLGDSVTVKAGYGRNYLLPEGKAVRATKKNLEAVKAHHAELEAKAAESLAQAQARADRLNTFSVKIAVLTSEEGKLYGSVGPFDIAAAATAAGVEVLKREIAMPEGPIHSVGEYKISVQVHSDITAQLTLVIVSQK